MASDLLCIRTRTEQETATFAAAVASRLRIGDTLLLEGPIGSGKSAFARALVRARLGRMEDVPSPTFTIVQTYDDPAGEIWHCDLYRLTSPDEAVELGLSDAFDHAICLIEWPDRLGADAPGTGLHLHFAAQEDHHLISADLSGDWRDRLGELFV